MRLINILLEQDFGEEIKNIDQQIKQAQLQNNRDLVRLLQRKKVLLNNMVKIQNDVQNLDVQIAQVKAQEAQKTAPAGA